MGNDAGLTLVLLGNYEASLLQWAETTFWTSLGESHFKDLSNRYPKTRLPFDEIYCYFLTHCVI